MINQEHLATLMDREGTTLYKFACPGDMASTLRAVAQWLDERCPSADRSRIASCEVVKTEEPAP